MAKENKKAAPSLEDRLDAALVADWEQPYKVPENWCWTKLDSVAQWGSGGTPSRRNPEYFDGYIPWVKTGELNDNYIYETEETLTEEGLKYSSVKLYPINTIVIAMYGATIGKVGILGVEATTNQACACGVCSSAINYRYLFYYARSQKENFIDSARGGAQPNISQEIIRNHPIPIPPLAEQQRIVDRIESLFAKLDEAKEKAQAVIDGYEDRKAAILHKAFTGELTEKWRETRGLNLSDWRKLQIRQIGEIITGSTPSTANREYYGGSIPFVKPLELNQGRHVSFSENTLTEAGKAVSRPIRAGATCICCIGATISKCGFLDVDSVTNQQINSIIPYEFMDDVFVYYYCCSKEFKDALIDNSSSTTLPIINKSKMSALSIVVPSKCEQIAISAILDNAFSDEQNAKDAAEQVIDHIETMKKSILARAFRGELGTNDPKDESAVELLKKVLDIEPTPQPRKKSISIPKEIAEKLKTELERKIIKLFIQKDTDTLTIQELISVSSKTFEVLETLRDLESRLIIKKAKDNNIVYTLMR